MKVKVRKTIYLPKSQPHKRKNKVLDRKRKHKKNAFSY